MQNLCFVMSTAAARKDGMQVTCDGCGSDISNLVQIRCAECDEYELCVPCFAKGMSSGTHKPWHDYCVIEQNAYPIFEEEWGADEEMMLIEGLEQYGVGAWQDVAEHIGGRTREETARHYERVYLNSPAYPVPDLTKEFNIPPEEFIEARKQRMERYRQQQAQMSPIKPKALASVPTCHEIQGYMPGRLEFDVEAENEAETSIKDMVFDPEDTDLDVELKLAVLKIYNARLTRRAERKRIMLAHNLMDYKRLTNIDKKRSKEDRDLMFRLKAFVRLLPPKEFEDFSESLLAEQQYRRRIAELQEYRQNGIKSLTVAAKYERDKAHRAQVLNRQSLNPLPRNNVSDETPPTIKIRKSGGNPLDISNAPEVELLTPQEKGLCAQLRILPRSFLAIKEIVFQELVKSSGVLKKKALKEVLSNVDDNKVNRIYDYFQSQNWIA